MSRIESLVKQGAKAARQVEVAVATLSAPRYATDLRRPYFVDYVTNEYVKAIQGLQAQGEEQNARSRAEIERRKDLRAARLAEGVGTAYKGVPDGAITAWREKAATMPAEDIARAFDSLAQWQQLELGQHPRTITRVAAGATIEVLAPGWEAVRAKCKATEAFTLAMEARRANLPEDALSAAAIERDEGALRADEGALAQIDALGWEKHIRQEFRLGDEPTPTASRDEISMMAFHLEGLRVPEPAEE